jgi:thiol-disulfide isomerase/thioredoxin
MKKILLVGLFIIVAVSIYVFLPRNKNTTTIKMEASQNKTVGRYIEYSKESFDKAVNSKRVYFFHAKWCPTCKIANEAFVRDMDKIPEDVILFKIDYDTEKELKTQYGISYQHTFVFVDSEGKEIRKWNGGDIEELISNTLK